MTKLYFHAARVFLGLVLVVAVLARTVASQLSAGVSFLPAAQAWLDVMASTGYLQTVLYVTEFVAGLALLFNFCIPLAVLVLAPITLNIALFHIFLQPTAGRMVQVVLMVGAHAVLAYYARRSLLPLFQPNSPARLNWKVGAFNIRLLIQIVLGAMFVVAGGAKLLIPARLSVGDALIDGMKATGYLYALLGITEAISGLFLAINRYVPLTLTVLAPIVLNIFLYHVFLAPMGLPVALILSSGYIAIVVFYAHYFRALLGFRESR
jgi:putative oxidoreductase